MKQVSHQHQHLSVERRETASQRNEKAERAYTFEVSNTQRYLLELDASAKFRKLRNTKVDKARRSKAEKVDGIGIQNARILSVKDQFALAKHSLDQRQRHIEKMYLGTKNRKAFFDVFEKHLGRAFDTRTGLVGGIGWLLGKVGLSYNRSLETKMWKQCGIKPENFRKLYKEMQTSLDKNKVHFEQAEIAEAKKYNKSVKEFRRSGEYKTFLKDIVTVGLSLGLNALGLTAGVAVPLMYFAPKRAAFAMDTDAVLKYMNEGVPYSEAVKQVSVETDKAVFMAHNLMRNANVLIAGPEGKNLAHLDKRWKNFEDMRSNFTFDKNKYNQGNIEEKNLYESLGFVIDSQGLMHLKEAKKLKNILFGFGERIFGDRRENKYFKQALKTLKKVPNKKKRLSLTESEIVALNQEKVEAVEIILERIKHENAEDFLRRGARKDSKKFGKFKAQQLNAGAFDKDDLKRKYRKKPDKMEGRIAALRQMERFVESQKVLVKNQRDFYTLKNLNSSAKTEQLRKSDILYKGAIVSFLASFTNARDVIKNFPVVPQVEIKNGKPAVSVTEKARQRKVVSLLHEYYQTKGNKNVSELTVINKLSADADFRSWMSEVGEWSKLQTKNNGCYQRMSCMEKIKYDVCRIKKGANKAQADYKFNSVAAVAPRGQGGGIPLIASTAWFDPTWLDIGKASTRDIIGQRPTSRVENFTETVMETRTIKDPFGGNITMEVPVEYQRQRVINGVQSFVSGKERIPLSATEKLIGDYGAVAGGIIAANILPGKTASQRRVIKDRKDRYKDDRKKS